MEFLQNMVQQQANIPFHFRLITELHLGLAVAAVFVMLSLL
jgi:hypothetical protein